VNRALTKKIIYVIVALTMLALLVPAMAVPVSAGPDGIQMNLVYGTQRIPDGTTSVNGTIEGFNIQGSIVEVSVASATYWNLDTLTSAPGSVHWYPSSVTPGSQTSVQVQGTYGEATITANSTGEYVKKKWGLYDGTEIQGAQSGSLTWNETAKAYFGSGSVTDTAYANFPVVMRHVAQGVILNWYLVRGTVNVSMAADTTANLKAYVNGLGKAQYTQFINKASYNPYPASYNSTYGWLGTSLVNITGIDGTAMVDLGAWFNESVKIVVIPEIPSDPNGIVVPEVTTYSFNSRQFEVVPQVRWAGEKIVLEANFTAGTTGDVNFYLLNNAVGTLEGLNDNNEQSTVWTSLSSNGTASAILYSATSGQADVIAALYANGRDGAVTNQYAFRVYFLDFYSIHLSDVIGKRSDHNAGWWTEPENPFNVNFPAFTTNATDTLFQTLNVSQDALERAQVKGWFLPNGALSTRDATYADINANGAKDIEDVNVPAGHYVLPDDWAAICGSTNWQQGFIHWDIMDSPNPADDSIAAVDNPLGDFKTDFGTGTLVAPANTVGPFAPGIEKMTVNGWMISNPAVDSLRQINTVVPNGKLDAWDAPMPPAKVVFEINSGAGYFKETLKTDVYQTSYTTGTAPNVTVHHVYTSPFYCALIPAHEAIPAINDDGSGGYSWNSFDGVHGAYAFWKIVNTPAGAKTYEDAAHPTKVEVYSDNHGEAMVWLNGDWNLGLQNPNGMIDLEPGSTVGTTMVQAAASYPYIVVGKRINSNIVQKEWTWGLNIFGTLMVNPYQGTSHVVPTWARMVLAVGQYYSQEGIPGQERALSEKQMVWVWLCDRDGRKNEALGRPITWNLIGTPQSYIPIGLGSGPISLFNSTTGNITVDNGFLTGTKRLINPLNPESYYANNGAIGYSVTREPTSYEKDLFTKFYGGHGYDANNFAVAAIEVTGNPVSNTQVDVQILIQTLREGTIIRHTNLNFGTKELCDDPTLFGDANADGVVNMADVVTVERIILGLAPRDVAANASWDINGDGSFNIDMGDAVRIEKIILTGN